MDPTILKALFEAAIKGIGSLIAWLAKKIVWPGRKSRDGRERRRVPADRRVRGLEYRLRYGLWLQFHLKTDLGRTQLLGLSAQHLPAQQRSQLYDAAIAEAERYEFSTRGTATVLPSSAAVQSVLELACADWEALPRKQQFASALTDALADRLTRAFNIRMLDRRLKERRASA